MNDRFPTESEFQGHLTQYFFSLISFIQLSMNLRNLHQITAKISMWLRILNNTIYQSWGISRSKFFETIFEDSSKIRINDSIYHCFVLHYKRSSFQLINLEKYNSLNLCSGDNQTNHFQKTFYDIDCCYNQSLSLATCTVAVTPSLWLFLCMSKYLFSFLSSNHNVLDNLFSNEKILSNDQTYKRQFAQDCL